MINDIKSGIARSVTCVDIASTWRVTKLERRSSEDEESAIDIEEKPMKKEKKGFVNASRSLPYSSYIRIDWLDHRLDVGSMIEIDVLL